MTARKTLLFAALGAVLFAAAPTFAQETPPDDPAAGTEAGVPQQRLIDAYVDPLFGGDDAAAGDAVAALRTGSDFTLTTTQTRQATNPDGTPATNPDGTPRMETVTVETLVANPNGPMGWGEVDHSLGLAQAMVGNGDAASVEEALMGAATTTTVTNADGTTTTTTTYAGGILQLRADGMGWGKIAKELGFKSLGEIKSGRAFADDGGDAGTATAAAGATAKGRDVARAAKPVKPERAAKPDKADRVARVERPAKVDRPERPERPSKPERVGRP